jgi:DNA-binding NarL/FixJ family response regulator
LRARRLRHAPAVALYTGSIRAQVVVAGAGAVVESTSSSAVLIEAIRHAAASKHEPMPVSREMRVAAAARLDPSDHAIFAMRLAGEGPAQIAATLGLNTSAIQRRIAHILRQLAPTASVA